MIDFIIPVSWEVSGELHIKANTLEEAIEEFDTYEKEWGYELSDTVKNSYVDGSFNRGDFELCKLINEV